jgi:hypothetical protein
MKKLTLCLMTALMMLAIMPSNLTAGTESRKITVATEKTVEAADANALIARLEVIKAMDLSTLSPVEKRQLRNETRAIKGTLNQMDGGVVYISAGGLILVLLLLIILL